MLRFTVRFDRFTQENEDDDYANEKFHYIPVPARRLLEQMRAELGQNDKLAGLWDTYHSRIIHDNLFCVWIGFDWFSDGPSFFRTMQETYDVHGMSGNYEVLDVAGSDIDPRKQHELLVKWCAEANKPEQLPALYELDEQGEATGELKFFCSASCAQVHQDTNQSQFAKYRIGFTPRNALTKGAHCYCCDKEL